MAYGLKVFQVSLIRNNETDFLIKEYRNEIHTTLEKDTKFVKFNGIRDNVILVRRDEILKVEEKSEYNI